MPSMHRNFSHQVFVGCALYLTTGIHPTTLKTDKKTQGTKNIASVFSPFSDTKC